MSVNVYWHFRWNANGSILIWWCQSVLIANVMASVMSANGINVMSMAK